MTGKMKWGLGLSLLAVAAAVSLGYSRYHANAYRNFGVEKEGVLYRSGQLSPAGFKGVLRERGIRTVVSLRAARAEGRPNPDAWEEDVCREQSPPVRYVRIKPKVWSADEGGGVPVTESIEEFLKVMDDPGNHPVLVHCMAGIHRTGQMCAVYRMEFDRWPVDRAMGEMKAYGYDLLEMHRDVSGYLKAYRPRWQRGPGANPAPAGAVQ